MNSISLKIILLLNLTFKAKIGLARLNSKSKMNQEKKRFDRKSLFLNFYIGFILKCLIYKNSY